MRWYTTMAASRSTTYISIGAAIERQSAGAFASDNSNYEWIGICYVKSN